MRTLGSTILFFAIVTVTVAGQTKSPATTLSKKPVATATRAIPAIKCVNKDTAAACKSFKELIDARDKGLLAQVLSTSIFRLHTSYVCLRPNDDFFSVVNVTIPEPKSYFNTMIETDRLLAVFAGDSLPTNASVRATLEESNENSKKNDEKQEFMDFSDPPAVSQYTKDKWYQDHSKEFVYSPGFVADYIYQNGIMGSIDDWGEWSMLASSKNGKQNDPPTWFLGGYAWIERYNSQHADESIKDDDPKHGHISVDTSSIYIHYKYENQAGDMVDYTMLINRLTGRFVESFNNPYGSDRDSGTCMIFK